jgi:hypothetical protein
MSPPGANIQSSAVYSGVPSAPAWQQNSAVPLAADFAVTIPDFHMAASSSEALQLAVDLAFLQYSSIHDGLWPSPASFFLNSHHI